MLLRDELQTTTSESMVLRTFKLSHHLNEKLKRAAHAKCMTVSEYLRFLIGNAEKESAGD